MSTDTDDGRQALEDALHHVHGLAAILMAVGEAMGERKEPDAEVIAYVGGALDEYEKAASAAFLVILRKKDSERGGAQ